MKKIFVRSKYSNFIAVQMWLLVVSFCHMLKIPADLILLKGGVLVNCLFAIANLPTHFAPTQIIILLFQNKSSFFRAVSLKANIKQNLL